MGGLQQIRLEELNLEDFRGEKIDFSTSKRRLLTFRRKISCPVCFHRFFDFKVLASELDSEKAEIIVFSPSDKNKLGLVLKGWDIDLRIVSDPNFNNFQKFHIKKSFTKEQNDNLTDVQLLLAKTGLDKYPNGEPPAEDFDENLPAEFLYDENNKLIRSHFYENLEDGIEMELISKFLKWNVSDLSTRKLQMS